MLTKRFGSCTCEKHAGVMDVNWVRTGSYTKELAKGILAAVRAARRAAGLTKEHRMNFLRNSCNNNQREKFFLACPVSGQRTV